MDVTTQPLKGEAMPLQRSPCDDFTSTVTPLDPDTPLCPTKTPSLSPCSCWFPLACRGPLWRRGRRNGWREGERRREKDGVWGGGGCSEKGAMQKVNCWSEVFIGSAGGREQEWEYALKTTV